MSINCDGKIMKPFLEHAVDSLLYIANQSGVTDLSSIKKVKKISREKCAKLLHQNMKKYEDEELPLMEQTYNMLKMTNRKNKYDNYNENFIKFYLPISLKNTAQITRFHNYGEHKASGVIFEEEYYYFKDLPKNIKDSPIYSGFKKFWKRKKDLPIFVFTCNLIHKSGGHRIYIVVENNENKVNIYLFDPHGEARNPQGNLVGKMLLKLFKAYYGKEKRVMFFYDDLSVEGIQGYSDDSIGFCRVFSVLHLYMLLTVRENLIDNDLNLPIYMWGRCIEKCLTKTFSKCQLMLVTVCFTMVTMSNVAYQKNVLEAEYADEEDVYGDLDEYYDRLEDVMVRMYKYRGNAKNVKKYKKATEDFRDVLKEGKDQYDLDDDNITEAIDATLEKIGGKKSKSDIHYIRYEKDLNRLYGNMEEIARRIRMYRGDPKSRDKLIKATSDLLDLQNNIDEYNLTEDDFNRGMKIVNKRISDK